MKKFLERFLYFSIGKITRTFYRITVLPYQSWPPAKSVPQKIREQAVGSSAQFANLNMRTALIFDSLTEFWDYVLLQVNSNYPVALEFGVWKGDSIRYFAKKIPSFKFFGFDSFEGLEEDWIGSRQPKGYFHLEGQLPKVPANVELIKGFYVDTLPNFIKNNLVQDSSLPLIHLDSDTYKPTKYILTQLRAHIGPGTILIFDEYFGLPFWEENEHKAFIEFISEGKRDFRYIAISELAVAVQILS